MAQIFVSYSRADRPFLNDFVPLVRKIYFNDRLWYDDGLEGGPVWWENILGEIAACQLFIYLISSKSLESPYCHKELREALRLHKPILPVIVRPLDSPYPENAPEDIKIFLGSIQYIDLVDMSDATQVNRLYVSIYRLLEQVQVQPPSRPLTPAIAKAIPIPLKPPRKWLIPVTEATGVVIGAIITSLVGIIVMLFLEGALTPKPLPPTLTFQPVTEVAIQPSNTPTATLTSTNTPTAIQATKVAYVIVDVFSKELGNGQLNIYYPDVINYPQTGIIELELIFNNYYITPTPFGLRTLVPVPTSTPHTSFPTPINHFTLTPHLPQYQTAPGTINIFELMGASLHCLDTSFSGCDAIDNSNLRKIEMNGAKWTWIISPRDKIDGLHNLTLELRNLISVDGKPPQANPQFSHQFQIRIIPTVPEVPPSTIEAIINAIALICAASLGAGGLVGLFIEIRNNNKGIVASPKSENKEVEITAKIQNKDNTIVSTESENKEETTAKSQSKETKTSVRSRSKK